MAGFRIAPREETTLTKPRPVKRRDYLAWIHDIPCVITGKTGVEACHLSWARPELGHYGRGKSRKASDRWVLPMSPEKHREQHSMGEQRFWMMHKPDPHILCLTLYGLWSDYGDEATEFATRIIMKGIRG